MWSSGVLVPLPEALGVGADALGRPRQGAVQAWADGYDCECHDYHYY